MDGIEYIFGLGGGEFETWMTPADLDLDGDGVLDAVTLDFDGDGLHDDALWDFDGDGAADRAVIDAGPGLAGLGRGLLGPDGLLRPEVEWYADPVGDGTWSAYRIGGGEAAEPEPPEPEPVEPELPARRLSSPMVVADPTPAILVDTDSDGIRDAGLTDSDGDGLLDTISAVAVWPRAGDWSGWAEPPR